MNFEQKKVVEKELHQVPSGKILLRMDGSKELYPEIPFEKFSISDESKGKLECYNLFDGLDFSIFSFLGSKVLYSHDNLSTYNFSYIGQGTTFWQQNNGTGLFLDSSKLVFSPKDGSTYSTLFFPEKYYRSCTISIQPKLFVQNNLSWLGNMDFDICHLSSFFTDGVPFVIPVTDAIANNFRLIDTVPLKYRSNYLKMKTQEILWQISQLDLTTNRVSFKPADKIEIICYIEKYLIDHVDTYTSVDALTKIFPLDKTTIQTTFKEVYGKPIATYMREHRLDLAKSMLLNGGKSVSDIAITCGFKSDSSFIASFKNVTGLTPMTYRSTIKNDPSC